MTVKVLVGETWSYTVEASSVRVAIAKACALHDANAKARQKQGLLTPETLAQMARKRGVRIWADIFRESSPEGDDAPKKPKRVKRGAIR